jgi:hypothetical protein
MKLNAAEPYFDGGVIRMNRTNTNGLYFMSTRNNNLSNRVQKGAIFVHPKGSITTQGSTMDSMSTTGEEDGVSIASIVSASSFVLAIIGASYYLYSM